MSIINRILRAIDLSIFEIEDEVTLIAFAVWRVAFHIVVRTPQQGTLVKTSVVETLNIYIV